MHVLQQILTTLWCDGLPWRACTSRHALALPIEAHAARAARVETLRSAIAAGWRVEPTGTPTEKHLLCPACVESKNNHVSASD